MERADGNLPFDEGFEDLSVCDLVWAHAISADCCLEHANYDNTRSFTGLLQRGLRDQEASEGRNGVLEMVMRYSACVELLNLAYPINTGGKGAQNQ